MLRVPRHFKHGRGTGAEEQVVEQSLVLEHQCGEFMRQGEDNMEVRHRQQLSGTRGQPLGACVSLALGAVPVAAGVVRDGLMSAADCTDRDDRPEPACGSGRWRRAPCDAAMQNVICAVPNKLLPDARMMSATSRVGRFIASCASLLCGLARGAVMESVSSGLGTASR